MAQFVENRKVLFVDDDEGFCNAFKVFMGDQSVEVYTLMDSTVIEDFLKSNGPFAVVLSDQIMPGKDGIAVLREVMKTSPDTMRIMVTGCADVETVKGAVNEGGIIQYISKPWNDDEVRSLINNLVTRYNATMEKRFLLGELKLKNEALQLILQGTETGVEELLRDLIAAVGVNVASQNLKIKKLGQAVLKMMPKLSEKEKWEIRRALELFNLGLALLPSRVQRRIITEGMGVIKEIPLAQNHHLLAAQLLSGIPKFEGVANIILLMRKDFDGIGEPYSNNTKGKDLPLGSRILRILLDLENKSTGHFGEREVLKSMIKESGIYDIELIGKLFGVETEEDRRCENSRV